MRTAGMDIRLTTKDDFSPIADLLNDQIMNGYAHFGTVQTDASEVEQSWSAHADTHPWLSAIDDNGAFLGFVKSAPWSSRGGYRWTVEVSVYIEKHARGRGVGTALYRELFRILKLQGYVIVYAGASMPNEASDRLHKSMGMTPFGEVTPSGFKQGRWIDVRYYQMQLVDPAEATPPMPVKPIASVYP